MVRHGPYELIFEAHRSFFPKAGYSAFDASALAEAAVAKLLKETAFGRPARYYVSAIPHPTSLLEFDQRRHPYSQVSSKWKTCALGKINDLKKGSKRPA